MVIKILIKWAWADIHFSAHMSSRINQNIYLFLHSQEHHPNSHPFLQNLQTSKNSKMEIPNEFSSALSTLLFFIRSLTHHHSKHTLQGISFYFNHTCVFWGSIHLFWPSSICPVVIVGKTTSWPTVHKNTKPVINHLIVIYNPQAKYNNIEYSIGI